MTLLPHFVGKTEIFLPLSFWEKDAFSVGSRFFSIYPPYEGCENLRVIIFMEAIGSVLFAGGD